MKKIYLLSVLFVALSVCSCGFVNAQGGVAMNTAGSMPDSSALFDISSTSKGALMPRMTTVQRNAIVNPAAGLTIFNTDCKVYNYNAGTPASPVWATINATNSLMAGVSISANPVGAICAGTSVTFTAVPSSGINSPSYQWQLNGANVGTNSSTYTNANLTNGDAVVCILSTNEACVTGSPATSNSITMIVNPLPSTPGPISGDAAICPGFSGNIYSISPVASATSYNWTVPADATIASGSGTATITVTFGSDTGNITVSAVNACGTSSASTLAISTNYTPGFQTFTNIGNQQNFTVPPCVSSVTIQCWGAQGYSSNPGSYPGGMGGYATGVLTVTPGSTLYVFVGGQNGYNGGGTGSNSGGNGGGESDVRVGGTAYSNWVIVAGGGGGASTASGVAGGQGGNANTCSNGAAGNGGSGIGSGGPGGQGTCTNGGAGGSSGGGYSGGGGGGGLTSGGGGSGGGGYANAGGDGTQGVGGSRGVNVSYGQCNTGCGGGGGYYGGGGTSDAQCAAGSGGGGSSWATTSMTNLSFSGGVQAGDGKVIITW